MRATNERLTILSEAEQSALYELPDFDYDQRIEYLTLTDQEQAFMQSRGNFSAKIYCALQIGYFKAKQMFFRFTWDEVDQEDIDFILQQYFDEKKLRKQLITKHEHYTQCSTIASLFEYCLWSKDFESLVYEQVDIIIQRDINPQFIVMELLAFLREKAFRIVPKEELCIKVANPNEKPRKEMDFK